MNTETIMDGLWKGPDGAAPLRLVPRQRGLRAYHDTEWGFPVRDDRALFEKISLEGFQSGLSWLTILRKRENFRRAFAGFDIERVARFGQRDVDPPPRRRRHRPASRQDREHHQQREALRRSGGRVRVAVELRLALRAGSEVAPEEDDLGCR